MSTFRTDGYNDALAGRKPSPPSHEKTSVYEIEYMEGYTLGSTVKAGEQARSDRIRKRLASSGLY